MTSDSGRMANERPFYSEFADAYDLLIADPVEPWVAAVNDVVGARAGSAQLRLLDAGCGTGRHAAAFSDAGYDVEMADASAGLLSIAVSRSPIIPAHLVDLTDFALGSDFDVVACRGVLNDILSDEDRRSTIRFLAEHVRPEGWLVLDIREAQATEKRQPTHTLTRVPTTDGELLFENESEWAGGQLVSHERFSVTRTVDFTEVYEFIFTMRPWTEREIGNLIAAAGLTLARLETAAYRASGDRLFCAATRAKRH